MARSLNAFYADYAGRNGGDAFGDDEKLLALVKLRLDRPDVYKKALTTLSPADTRVFEDFIRQCERSGEIPTVIALDAYEAKHKKQFATLADDFRAALVDNTRMGYPLEVLEPEVRAMADAACRALIPYLHRSHRIVLDEDFTRLAAEVAVSAPIDLARYLDLARLPFDNVWLEWPQPVRRVATVGAQYARDEHIPPRVGVLISPIRLSGDAKAYRLICVQGYEDQCAPSPIGLIFSWTHDISEFASGMRIRYFGDDPIAQDEIDIAPIGRHYMAKLQETDPDQMSLAKAMSGHAWMVVAPPFGPFHVESFKRAQASGDTAVMDRQQEWLGLNTRDNDGLWRWLIAVFGLINTGGGEFVFTQSRRQKSQMYDRGKRHLPAYEYRILKLKRPTNPEVVKKALPSTSSLGRRWHMVPKSWHHRRLATAECARHPKVCPIARWEKVFDEEGKPIGQDQHRCTICKRLRWIVDEHPRGDKALGIVDKGYEIITTGQPRSHETIEVVEELPRGVKIKTIPRFEPSIHREENADEHSKGNRDPGS